MADKLADWRSKLEPETQQFHDRNTYLVDNPVNYVIQDKEWAEVGLLEDYDALVKENKRLANVAAAAKEILQYQTTGAPDYSEWEAKFEALAKACTELENSSTVQSGVKHEGKQG